MFKQKEQAESKFCLLDNSRQILLFEKAKLLVPKLFENGWPHGLRSRRDASFLLPLFSLDRRSERLLSSSLLVLLAEELPLSPTGLATLPADGVEVGEATLELPEEDSEGALF